jgi:Fe-S-cluster containining protein
MAESLKKQLNDLQFEYDFPETQGFECNPDKVPCGGCCSQPFMVTFKEVNLINDFLKKWLFSEDFKGFVLDHATYFNKPMKFQSSFLEELYEKYRKDFQMFFKPAYFGQKDDTHFVLNYRFSYHRETHQCIFFNPITYKCAIHNFRPAECRLYPFNFEYDFTKSRKVTVFITPECEGEKSSLCEALLCSKPIDKSSLEKLIQETVLMYFDLNITLEILQKKTGFPLKLTNDAIQKRELRPNQKILEDFSKKMATENHISKQNTKNHKMRDIFLEEHAVTCLNQKEYNRYLLRLQKKQPELSDWE